MSMGIYLSNMKMLVGEDEGLLIAIHDGKAYQVGTSRMYNAIEIPAQHGDLIDRDPFIEFIKTHWDSYDQWFVEQLEARPTIIPAEEGE